MRHINRCFVSIAVMFLIHGLAFAQGPALTAKSTANVDILISRGLSTNYGNLQYASEGNLRWAIGLRGVGPAESLFFHDEDAFTTRMMIDGTTGNVGIGLTNAGTPDFKLHVNGPIAAPEFIQISSRQLKTAIEPLGVSAANDMLSQLAAMELTTYEYKSEYGGDGRRHLGFIAEDVPAELQSSNGQGLDLYALVTYTVGALQAQQRQIDQLGELRTTHDRLKTKYDELISELARLQPLITEAATH